jgi:Family of unknown function (DUF5677)
MTRRVGESAFQPGVVGTPDAARALIADLVALTKPCFPKVVERRDIADHPFLVPGFALLSGAVSTVESISFLSRQERESDCNSLLRDLVDRAIVFAWLAADPAKRVPIWEKEDMRKRIAMDSAVKKFGALVLEPEWRAELEARIKESKVQNLPKTEQLAQKADEYWRERVRFFRDVVPNGNVFEMIYAGVFRWLSGFTHAAPAAISCVLRDTPKERVVILEPTTGPQRAVSFASLAFALILFIASEALGCPSASDTHAAVSTHAPGMLPSQ